jgi:hypothetical protein
MKKMFLLLALCSLSDIAAHEENDIQLNSVVKGLKEQKQEDEGVGQDLQDLRYLANKRLETHLSTVDEWVKEHPRTGLALAFVAGGALVGVGCLIETLYS